MIEVALLACLLQEKDDATAAFERVLRKTREKVERSVVAIEVVRTADPEGRSGSGPSGTHKDYYNRPEGPTSGTILTEDGYILTSWFNLSGDVKKVTVTMWDGKDYAAMRLGYDETRDIALLKIEAKGLPVLPKAKLDELKQGDFVAIVGRSPDKGVATINQGILSATTRMKGTAVQTDAELNYGNVGGPLVTLKGELIGVTSHIRPRQPWGQSSGVGFATKIAEIDKVFEDLKKSKTTVKTKTPWLGVLFGEGAEGEEGVRVTQVVANSPAEEAGVEEGDVIIEFDGKVVKNADDLRKHLGEKKPGDEVTFKVKRIVKEKPTVKTMKAKLEVNPN
jgi:serine protease Do